ncbi:unnamed protein product [Ilex paraguariensis]|uniref:Gamma-glutamyltranspeptidase 1 n=1 Tax=Ilex paraguariensis TaxID=185542 RepID=A0ABC8UVN5_9AQUA
MSWLACATTLLFMLLWSSRPSLTNAATRGEMIRARSGVTATDDTQCSKVGRNVLREQGHAVDAAVAAVLCLGVVNAAGSGLGGGGFMLVKIAKGEAKVFDMREMAPKQASQERVQASTIIEEGEVCIEGDGHLALEHGGGELVDLSGNPGEKGGEVLSRDVWHAREKVLLGTPLDAASGAYRGETERVGHAILESSNGHLDLEIGDIASAQASRRAAQASRRAAPVVSEEDEELGIDLMGATSA